MYIFLSKCSYIETHIYIRWNLYIRAILSTLVCVLWRLPHSGVTGVKYSFIFFYYFFFLNTETGSVFVMSFTMEEGYMDHPLTAPTPGCSREHQTTHYSMHILYLSCVLWALLWFLLLCVRSYIAGLYQVYASESQNLHWHRTLTTWLAMTMSLRMIFVYFWSGWSCQFVFSFPLISSLLQQSLHLQGEVDSISGSLIVGWGVNSMITANFLSTQWLATGAWSILMTVSVAGDSS